MKKSELRKLIKEEIRRLKEVKNKFDIDDKALYYPYGKNGDSIEVYIFDFADNDVIKRRHGQKDDKYIIKLTGAGIKDIHEIGFDFDEEDGELVGNKELNKI